MIRRGAWGLIAAAVGLAWFSAARAQTLQTLVSNGPTSQRINLTFFSEGYTAAELPAFVTNVSSVLVSFFSTPPYNVYANCFNINAVSVASAQSGADHYTPGVRLVDTYFNSSFDSYGANRVLTIPPNDRDASYANGQGKVDALVASLIPESDLEVVLVNDLQYGGTGGARLVVSLAGEAPEIALHEMGHTLAKLGDEYSDPFPYGNQEEPNTTTQTERSLIKWNSWILPGTPVPTPAVASNFTAVGLFEGAHYHATGWYRPQHNCKMRTLGAPFCAVCRETVVLAIYRLVRPIDGFSPIANLVSLTNTQTFRVTPLKLGSGGFTYQWFTNNVAVTGANKTNLLLTPQMLGPGTHSVRVEVHDPTSFVRNDPSRLLYDTNSWAVSVTAVLALTAQPQNQSVVAGTPAAFSVAATGAPPITYQWRFNSSALGGQTNSTLTIASAAAEHGGNYDVIVANEFAALTSTVATLNIQTPTAPSILSSPADQTIHAGASATFWLIANGTAPLTYFWSKDSVIVATNLSPSFTVAEAQLSDAGDYSVLVSNVAGIAASGSAALTVLPAEPVSVGAYNGLFFNSNDVQQASSGFFSAIVRTAGEFSARVRIGTGKQSFKGRFGTDGRATNTVMIRGATLEVRLSSDAQATNAIRGVVTDGVWTSELLAQRVSPQVGLAGQYTLLFSGVADGSVAPVGNGFASVRVNNSGVAAITGRMADGTRLSLRTTLVGSGELPVYAPLYSGKGAVFGWLRLKQESYIDLDGTAYWLRPPIASSKYYKEGFAIETPVSGSAYTRSSGTLFTNIVLARVVLTDGNLEAPLTNYVTLGVNSRVTASGPDKLQLKVTPATGLFKGTITPAGERPVKVQGAILQRQRFGGGFFLGTNESGRVYFGP